VIALDTPGSLPFPIIVIMPAVPVSLELAVGNSFIIPSMSIPVVVSVIASPSWIYIIVKAWDAVIISPSTIIVIGPVPVAVP